MEAHNNLGARYIAPGRKREAADHLQTALRLDPSSALAQLNAGFGTLLSEAG
jgi:Tfp pilus assembly protein PilF